MVALNGDITFTVFKQDVTVPEIAILRAIHGADAVRDIKPLHMDKRSHSEERQRLLLEYGNAKDSKDESIFEKLFPGLSPLPVTFKDIGIDLSEEDPFVEEEKPRRGRPAGVKEETISE
jgi:hypothetical protein